MLGQPAEAWCSPRAGVRHNRSVGLRPGQAALRCMCRAHKIKCCIQPVQKLSKGRTQAVSARMASRKSLAFLALACFITQTIADPSEWYSKHARTNCQAHPTSGINPHNGWVEEAGTDFVLRHTDNGEVTKVVCPGRNASLVVSLGRPRHMLSSLRRSSACTCPSPALPACTHALARPGLHQGRDGRAHAEHKHRSLFPPQMQVTFPESRGELGSAIMP